MFIRKRLESLERELGIMRINNVYYHADSISYIMHQHEQQNSVGVELQYRPIDTPITIEYSIEYVLPFNVWLDCRN